jgi:hypothetical protein
MTVAPTIAVRSTAATIIHPQRPESLSDDDVASAGGEVVGGEVATGVGVMTTTAVETVGTGTTAIVAGGGVGAAWVGGWCVGTGFNVGVGFGVGVGLLGGVVGAGAGSELGRTPGSAPVRVGVGTGGSAMGFDAIGERDGDSVFVGLADPP